MWCEALDARPEEEEEERRKRKIVVNFLFLGFLQKSQ